MAISAGLVAKAAAGTAAAASSVAAGVIYRDNIAYYFKSEIGRVNWYIDFLGLPEGCKFNEESPETKKECDITKEQLKKINFSNKKKEDLTVDESFSDMKLEIKRISEEDIEKYEFYDDLKFTFKDFSSSVTVKNDTDSENINLIKDTNPEFKINDSGRLEKAWDADKLAKEISITCPNDNECEVTNLVVSLDNGSQKITDLTLSPEGTSNNKFTLTKDQEGYNQGFKFTVKGSNITLGNQTLTCGDSYEVKYTESKWYLTKKDPAK